MSHTENIITRFAPSPTGLLHVGGGRTAIYNWAFARRHGGKFLLRLEDTDRKRSSEQSAQTILDDLKWLGLDWDNANDLPRQSEHLEAYNEAIDRLLDSGAAYADSENPTVIYMRMGREAITVHDLVLGDVTVEADQQQDFVIRKSDGFPTYHLACVVDDAAMGVTHVLRAQEHLMNSPKHIALQTALDLLTPAYAHMPLIFNSDGSKMSKRDKAKVARKALRDNPEAMQPQWQHFAEGDTDDLEIAAEVARALDLVLPEINVADFRATGYLPGVLVNYLALLGWNPGEDVEQFGPEPLAFLAEHFTLDRLGKSNAKFDREKLMSFNADALAAMPLEKYTALLRQYLLDAYPIYKGICENQAKMERFAEAYQQRGRTFSEVAMMGRFFILKPDQIEYEDKAIKKVLEKSDGWGVLQQLREILGSLGVWNAETTEQAVKHLAESLDIKMGKVAQPLRVAVTGGTVSPPIGLTLEVLGQSQTLARIDACLELKTD